MKREDSIIDLPKILDIRGNLSFIESNDYIPFNIKRAHWIYDVPGGMTRGGHAYKKTQEFIVAMSGSFDVEIHRSDGSKESYHLNRSYYGLYVPSGTWRELSNFSSNSLALVLSSTYFDIADYIDDFSVFKSNLLVENELNKLKRRSIEALKYNPNRTSVFDCTLLELDKHTSELGNLSVMENNFSLPFNINRVYYLYDIPGGQSRGAHAHKNLQQFIVSVGGSFDITLDDGCNRRTFTLNRPYYGLLIPPGIWRDLINFSAGATCLVLASEHYTTEDYIRTYNDFLDFKRIERR